MQLLVLVAAVVSAVTTPAPTEAVLPTRDVPVAEATARPEPTILRQCDPRWEHVVLRSGTLCRSGCLVFALRRAFEDMGQHFEPAELAALLRDHEVFDSNDNVIWGNISDALPVVASRRGRISSSEVQEHLRRGRKVVLRVPGSRDGHWVYAAQVVGDDILVDDSRDGTRVSLRERYGRNVSGHAVLEELPMVS